VHDPIVYAIDVERGSIGLSVTTLIPIYDFYGIFSVTARYGEIGEIRGVTFGCRRQGCGQHKAAFYVYGGMFLQAIVRDIVFDSLIGFEIPADLQRLSVCMPGAIRGISFIFHLPEIIIAYGPAG
jgi:hypothetical protein